MTLTTATLLEAALSYAELGWPVVPLHTPRNGVCDCPDTPKRPGGERCISPGKHPRLTRGVLDASTDPDRIRMWWGPKMWPQANIGIDLQRAGLVDVAPDSIQWQAEFIVRGLPPTPWFRSGGGDGHEHRLYRRPDVCPIYRLCRPDEYDILSAGYAVMPPSLHASGRHYAWNSEPEVPRTAAPMWVVQKLREQVKKPENGTVTFAPATSGEPPVQLTSEAMRRWTGALSTFKADHKVDRSFSLWAIGCDLAAAGATRGTIASSLQERDETLGWSKYAARRDAQTRYLIIADRVLSGQAPRIRLKKTSPNGQVVEAVSPERRFKLITADELKNRPDPEWLVDNVIQKDTLALLVGAQETLKTFTALDMALSVGTDSSWQGYPVTVSGVAIYVSSEGGSGLGLRVAAWEKTHDIEVGSRCLFLADQAPQLLDRKNGGDVDELLASIAELGAKPVLIVIDTAARSMVGGDENSAQDMGLFIASADQIRQATGAVVLLVHHNNKAGGARGSTALLGAVHTIIESSREENSKYLILKCGKQKDADHFETLMMETQVVELGANEKTGVVRTSLVLNRRSNAIRIERQAVQLSTTERSVLVALIELEEASFSQWQSACGLAKQTFVRARAMLIESGYVYHNVDRYTTSETGREVGTIRYHSGTAVPNGTEATGGTRFGTTTGSRKGGPVVPLGPRGTVGETEPDEELPW